MTRASRRLAARAARCLGAGDGLGLALALALALAVAPANAAAAGASAAAPAGKRDLRVCADPNNLPFSNDRLQGFENRIAALVGRDLHRTVRYTWWAQRRGFFRNTLKAGLCDVVVGVPVGFEMAAETRPYYRSSYVWLTRRGEAAPASFDDPRLSRWKIGVQVVGNDYANTPPAHALLARGLVTNVVGFTLYGDYSKPNPPAEIVDAVARGRVDAAVVWGPLAGYFARRSRVPLRVTPVAQPQDLPGIPFAYDIGMGVRRRDKDLLQELDGALARHRAEIDRILDAYGVPRVEPVRGPAVRAASASIRAPQESR